MRTTPKENCCARCGDPLPDPPGQGRWRYCPPWRKDCALAVLGDTDSIRQHLFRRGFSRRDFLSTTIEFLEGIAVGLAAEVLGMFYRPQLSSSDDFYETAWEALRKAKAAFGVGGEAYAEREARRVEFLLKGDQTREASRIWIASQAILRDTAQEPIEIKHRRAALIEWALFYQRDWLNLANAFLAHSNLWRSQSAPDYKAALQLADDALMLLREFIRKNLRNQSVLILQGEASHWILRNVAMEGESADPFSRKAEKAYARLEQLGGNEDKIGEAGSIQLRVEALREGVGLNLKRAWKSRYRSERYFKYSDEAEEKLNAAKIAFYNLPPHLQPKAHTLSFPRMEVEILFLARKKKKAIEKVEEFLEAWGLYSEAYAARTLKSLVEKYAQEEVSKIDWPSDDARAVFIPGIPYIYLEKIFKESKLLL